MGWAPAALSAVASLGGGFLSGMGNAPRESKMQKTQRKLVDKLIASLEGTGPFADLFNANENVFQKSFVEPAMSQFRNQIAPQIQQSSIFGGQQRGTGLDDQLLRAGVDLDQLLNQQMMDFYQGAQNRKQNTIGNILGAGAGAAAANTPGQVAMSAAGGTLSSDKFSDSLADMFKKPMQDTGRRGFSTGNQF